MNKQHLELNGKQVSYLDSGDNTRPVVLMVHGFPESSLLWQEIIPSVEACGFRAIAPDLPGFGQSERFAEASTWERYVQFLNEFLAALEITDVHLFVHDWGGLIGLRWAADHPERALSLVITDTTFTDQYTWHETAQSFRTPGVGEVVMKHLADRDYFDSFLKRSAPPVSESVIDDFYQLFATNGGEVALELYRSGDPEKLIPYRGKLSAVTGPATIIFGENDPYVSADNAFTLKEQQLPQANIYLIPHAGHFIHIEVPETVREIVEKHLQNVLAEAATK